MNRVMLTCLLALHAADTGYLADLHGLSTLLLVAAHYMCKVSVRNDLDQVLGTGLYTESAGNALVLIDHGKAVLDDDGLLRADRGTVSLAEASERTGGVALEHKACSLTGINTIIYILGRCIAAYAIAVYECCPSLHSSY